MRRRRSVRLKGYEYSGPAEYYVTVCAHRRKCIFGDIVNLSFRPSRIGMVVKQCWEAIPEHFPQVRLGVFQVMPNHIHGIISIQPVIKSVGAGHVQPLQKQPGIRPPAEYQHVSPGSLGSIVRSFKAAVTKASREMNLWHDQPLWQRNFHDHIIRDDVSYFYIERYIELNPVFWDLDIENPRVSDDEHRLEALRHVLLSQLHFAAGTIEYLIQNELDYRVWRRNEFSADGSSH